MKIYLDDIRNAPDDSWTVIRDPNKVMMDYITTFAIIDEISFDHDLGENVATGYDLLCWIERNFAEGTFYGIKDCKFSIHSANPVGCKNMQAAIASIERLRNG